MKVEYDQKWEQNAYDILRWKTDSNGESPQKKLYWYFISLIGLIWKLQFSFLLTKQKPHRFLIPLWKSQLFSWLTTIKKKQRKHILPIKKKKKQTIHIFYEFSESLSNKLDFQIDSSQVKVIYYVQNPAKIKIEIITSVGLGEQRSKIRFYDLRLWLWIKHVCCTVHIQIERF